MVRSGNGKRIRTSSDSRSPGFTRAGCVTNQHNGPFQCKAYHDGPTLSVTKAHHNGPVHRKPYQNGPIHYCKVYRNGPTLSATESRRAGAAFCLFVCKFVHLSALGGREGGRGGPSGVDCGGGDALLLEPGEEAGVEGGGDGGRRHGQLCRLLHGPLARALHARLVQDRVHLPPAGNEVVLLLENLRGRTSPNATDQRRSLASSQSGECDSNSSVSQPRY
eukprot:530543-Prorocentrum_minimum.AAC.9